MIFDSLNKIQDYASFNKHLPSVIEFLSSGQLHSFSNGKHTLNESVFFILMEYDLKKEEDALWEAHRKYLDVQIVLDGDEKVAHSYLEEMMPTQDYNDKDDYQLFKGPSQNLLALKKGWFAIFAPQDVHKTSMQTEWDGKVKKVVFKLPVA